MSKFSKRSILTAAASVVLALSGAAFADDQPALAPAVDNSNVINLDTPTTDTTLTNPANSPTLGESKKAPIAPSTPAAEAAAPETPNIHGFFNSPFKTGYLTPRGLYVQDKGVVWQPIVGLVLPIGDLGPLKKFTAVGGIWNSVDTAEAGAANPTTGGWDEMDPFIGVSANITDEIGLALTYTAFDSPQHAYSTEHNIDLKITYDDSKWALWGSSGFALHPYLDCWWAVSGGSTVVLGRAGATGYFEPGVVPSFTVKAIPDYPITFTVPMYVSVGPRTYWAINGEPGGNFGLVSGSLNASMPLSFIPTKFGFWHTDLGFTYDYLINTSLLHAGTILCGNTDRNCFLASLGFGINF
jgi:hypothetical protein